jgi:dihydroorotase-like cyclic amidohydrolase
VAYFKVFMCTTHGVPGFDPARLRQLFQLTATLDAPCLVHCEDESMTALAQHELQAAGREDGALIPQWRHQDAELAALNTAVFLARQTGAQMIAAHVSSPAGIAIVQRERAAGGRILAECCPQYLTLQEDEVLTEGPFRKFTPPARARTTGDLAAMWQALRQGQVNHVSTDHAPSTRQQKTAGSLWDAPFGLPGLDTTLPVLLDAAAAGLVSYERVVEAYSEAPARTYGLHPRKGHLGVGGDADIVLVDPTQRWTVADAEIRSGAGWSPYSGRTLVGRAVRTYLRGTLACDGDDVVAIPGTGQFLAGKGRDRV